MSEDNSIMKAIEDFLSDVDEESIEYQTGFSMGFLIGAGGLF